MSFSFSSDKNKNKQSYNDTTSIAPIDYNRQVANYDNAVGSIPSTYTPTSAAQISAQFNPFQQNVIDGLLANAGQGQRMALNLVGDRASAAHAFGGDRQGVAQGVALGEFDRNLNSQIGGLLYSGYNDAAGRAQDENRYGYAYPIARQGLLNSTLNTITPTTYRNGTSTSKTTDQKWGWESGSPGGGGGGGGGSPDYAKMIAQYVMG